MAKRKDKPTPINREKFLNNLHDPYQIPEQVEQPYDNSNPDAKYRKPGEPEFLRANEISMKGDTNNVINITLEDHDEAILYYIKNVIKPTVEINGNQQEVPVIYGSPERWKSMQKDGFFRDKNGKAFIPIIAVKRESFEKDRRLGNKLDGNKVQNVQYFKTGYSKRNGYDNFSVLQNQKPAEEYQVGVIPDYITVTYKLSIFTDYVEHMNSIIEAIEFASDSYWGDKERFNFRASITQFPTPTEVVNGNDRAVKSDLTLTINGYIVPKSINVQKAAPSPKSYNVTKFVFKEFAQESTTSQIDKDGNKVITYTNPSQNNVSYFGTFNGNFIGDGSGLINLPNQNIDTGSLVTTSSFNNFTSSYNQDSASFDSRINNINFDTGSLVTTSSFNEFISNYNTGSFVGLFEGNLIGTSSYSQNSLSSSYYDEQDPIFQASEASLFISGDKANLDNQSGVNTGDETTSTIQSKRPIKTIEGESIEGVGNVLLSNKADLVGGIHLQSQSRPSNVIYNSTNGVLSFTWADGSIQNIDLPVENLFENASYNSSTQILTLTTTTGGVVDIDLSSLVDLPEIVLSLNSNPSVLPTTGQKVYFRIDNGSYWINNSGTWSNEYKGFTQAEKTKLSGIESGAQVNVNPDWNAVTGSSQILNKPTNLSQFTNDANFVKLIDSNELYDYKTVTYNKTTNLPTFTSTAINNVEGLTLVVAGATARTFNDTNIYTRTNRLGSVTITTTNLAQIRQLALYINGNTGYEAIYKFGFSENATDTAIRAFAGLSANTLFSNTEPNTLLNCIGFCRLSTSNNLHLIHNDNSGIATTVDLGSNFPANTVDTDVYLVKINSVAGSNSINIQLLRVNTNHLYTTTLTTDIPALSQGLNFGMYIVDTAGANTPTGMDFMGMTIKN